MEIYLGLGSNLGKRRENLSSAIRLLEGKGLRVNRVSPAVESPALLPESAPSDWNLPYLNLAVECVTESSPDQVRSWITEIESSLGRARKPGRAGRKEHERWSPRPIDIDILLWGREVVSSLDLTIPHRDLHKRGFVLTPLVSLQPRLTIPGRGPKTLLEWSAELQHHIPLWMGIVNVTPDSFSDGGLYTTWEQVEPHVDEMVAAGAQIIDVGAQSTRPDAKTIGPEDEWSRLAPVIEPLTARYSEFLVRPLLSVDTFYPAVAERALDLGVDMINDVSGLTSPEMIDVARSSDADWIAMHHLTLPVDPNVTLPPTCDPAAEVEAWLHARLRDWEADGLDLNRIIFDPGIGFGKSALQSLELLRQAGRFRQHGLRTLIGHSRKSFMKSFSSEGTRDLDLVTIGASLELCKAGVDILRVHNVPDHLSAYRGWSHLLA